MWRIGDVLDHFSSCKGPRKSIANQICKYRLLKGKKKEDIIAVVGPPNSISATPDGGQLLQWISTGYHIVIVFDANGICQGVTHETSV